MKEITVSHHAIIRFMQRALRFDEKHIPTQQEMDHVNDMILSELKDKYPLAFELGAGEYRLRDYEVIVVLINFKITTVKTDCKEDPKLNGGILRSGGKVKKLRGSRYIKKRHAEKSINASSAWNILDND